MTPTSKMQLITLPPGWTAKKDREAFDAHIVQDAGHDYRRVVLDSVKNRFRELEDVMDDALDFFQVIGVPMTLFKSVEMLEDYIQNRSPSADYQQRFKENLAACRFALTEHERLWPQYADEATEGKWFLPLMELDDWLFTAADTLDESMCCEHNALYWCQQL